jgi:hypothetical protein
MPTNDVPVTIKGLRIKYASDAFLRPSSEQLHRLCDGWERANQVLRSVLTERLESLITDATPLLSGVGQPTIDALQWHFKLPPLGGASTPGERIAAATWKTWVEPMKQIRSTLAATLAGLSTNGITIADNFMTVFKRELRAGGTSEIGNVQRAISAAAGSRGAVSLKKAAITAMPQEDRDKRSRNDLSAALTPDQKGSIHINFVTQLAGGQTKNLHVARTIIHEATHKFADTRDFAYADDAGYKDLSMEQALCNADSYAYTAVSLYKNYFFKNSAEMLQLGATMNLDV